MKTPTIKKIMIIPFWLFLLLNTSSCEKIFVYSPFEVNIPDKYQNTISKQLGFIMLNHNKFSDTSVFYIISDSHIDYQGLRKAVNVINKNKDAEFVIHLGDQTDAGTEYEYINTYQIMDELKLPWLMVIGNHDCLSNGFLIYKKIYGPDNYSFKIDNNVFIVFNTVVLELSINSPDFTWLDNELKNYTGNNCIVLSHIQPWDEVLYPDLTQKYYSILKNHNVRYTLHGHLHTHTVNYNEENNVTSIISGSTKQGYIFKVIFSGSSLKLVKVYF